ncbi:Cytosine/adenosine deaminase [Thiothrix eikelboomii]|uniref:5-methylthioadenosine/S-adenosylhomocysteine deaminase n=1 Tax=Thiothrix eikelboomii TaxID=92487 RepID=A0A1T4W4W7_9GAMM|nr:TRZ/ATZ family hydrolase [Thiothrix eikelboomii]SKA72075.1 Cytosine/adenosine deaminase [Thiothrix eikelboomii]
MQIDLLIKPGWVITVNQTDQVLKQHAVAVHAGKILAILPEADAEATYQATKTVVLPQQAILPGLINAHTHAAMSLLKGLADDLPLMAWLQEHIWPAERQWANQQFVYEGSKLAIAEMLRSGTTCFNDMYFFAEETVKAVQESGIRASLGMILVDFPTTYAADVDTYLQRGLALREQVKDDPLISLCFAPHAPYTVSDQSLQRLQSLAEAFKLPIHIHMHETAQEVAQAVALNQERPLARFERLGLLNQRFLAVHLTQLNTSEIALLAYKQVQVIHCPESNLKLASGFCPVAQLIAAGVNVALGTDSNASNNDLDLFGEMRTAALLAKAVDQDASVVSAHQVLRMATINGAKALGLDQAIGSIEIGKSADLITINLGGLEAQPMYDPISHLVYCTTREQVSWVWVAGKALLEERKLSTLNEAELIKSAQHWQSLIGETAG